MLPKPTKATEGRCIVRPTPSSLTDTAPPSFTSVSDSSSVLPLEDPEDPEDLCSSTTGAKEGPISSFVLVVRFIPRSDDVDVVIITSRPGAVSVTV